TPAHAARTRPAARSSAARARSSTRTWSRRSPLSGPEALLARAGARAGRARGRRLRRPVRDQLTALDDVDLVDDRMVAAPAAVDPVLDAVDRVDRVVPRPAEDAVDARAAVDHVVARSALEQVVAGPAEDRV